ncbi:MAG: PH domain-containing protein [Acidimicrobiales bacterium]
MPFPTKLLNQGEEVLRDLRPHWFYLAPASLWLGLALVVWVALAFFVSTSGAALLAGAALFVLALANFLFAYAKWATTNFVVTDSRVIYRSGLVSKHGIEIPLDKINTVFFKQSITERLLGAGDLVIESAGERGQQAFSDIRRPQDVQQVLNQCIDSYDQRKLARMSANAPPPASTIPEEIRKLAALRDEGIISRDEFEAKKHELLGRM